MGKTCSCDPIKNTCVSSTLILLKESSRLYSTNSRSSPLLPSPLLPFPSFHFMKNHIYLPPSSSSSVRPTLPCLALPCPVSTTDSAYFETKRNETKRNEGHFSSRIRCFIRPWANQSIQKKKQFACALRTHEGLLALFFSTLPFACFARSIPIPFP